MSYILPLPNVSCNNYDIFGSENTGLIKRPGNFTDQLTKKPKVRSRITWQKRAAIMFCYLHRYIGNKDKNVICKLSGIEENTFRGWVTKTSLIPKWLCFVKTMTAKEAFELLDLSLDDYPKVLSNDKVDLTEYRDKEYWNNSPYIDEKSVLFTKESKKSKLIRSKHKQISFNGRKSKYNSQREYLNNIISVANEKKELLTVENLRQKMVEKFSSVKDNFFKQYCDPQHKHYPNNLRVWIRRSFRPIVKTKRGKRSLKLPVTWRQMSVKFQNDFKDWFEANQFDIVVSSSEVIVDYNDSSMFSELSTERCQVLVSVELTTSQVLTPIFGFNAVNENHVRRQRSSIFQGNKIDIENLLLYQVKCLLKQFPGRNIGWIVDNRRPLSSTFRQSIQEFNFGTSFTGSMSFLNIPNNLSSILNVTDVELIPELRKLNVLGGKEGLVIAFEDFISTLNQKEAFTKRIYKSFGKLGQNPLDSDGKKAFEEYILNLKDSEVELSHSQSGKMNFT